MMGPSGFATDVDTDDDADDDANTDADDRSSAIVRKHRNNVGRRIFRYFRVIRKSDEIFSISKNLSDTFRVGSYRSRMTNGWDKS